MTGITGGLSDNESVAFEISARGELVHINYFYCVENQYVFSHSEDQVLDSPLRATLGLVSH